MKQRYQGRKLDGSKFLEGNIKDGNVKAARVENEGRVLSPAIQTDSDLCDLNWLSTNEEGVFHQLHATLFMQTKIC
jgi:hypothetical protein